MASSVVACARAESFEAKNNRPAQQIGRIDQRAAAEKKSVFLIELGHDYKIVINGKTNFGLFAGLSVFDYEVALTVLVKGQPQPASTTSCGVSTSLIAELHFRGISLQAWDTITKL